MRRALFPVGLVVSSVVLSLAAMVMSLFDRKGDRIHVISRFWGTVQLATAGIKVRMEGLDRIPSPPYIFMCNHQSALDIYALLSSLPLSFRWIAKHSLFRIPFLGWAMARAGHISIDRGNAREALKAIDEAARKIREGLNIVMFPEGTRSPDGTLLPFKKGGFALALRAGVPVVPVGIEGTSRLQPKGSLVPRARGTVHIRIGEPMEVGSSQRSAKAAFMEDVRTRIAGLMAAGE